ERGRRSALGKDEDGRILRDARASTRADKADEEEEEDAPHHSGSPAHRRDIVPARCVVAVHFEILTRVTALTKLLASTKSPSRVTEVLRTMLPPPGIAQLWNFSVLGSKRTIVFGVDPDSLYQMMSLIAEMPYGSDFGPLGDGHSVTLPVAGSRRPRYPRE